MAHGFIGMPSPSLGHWFLPASVGIPVVRRTIRVRDSRGVNGYRLQALTLPQPASKLTDMRLKAAERLNKPVWMVLALKSCDVRTG